MNDSDSSETCNGIESVALVSADILLGIDEVGNEGSGVNLLIVGETEDISLGLAVDVLVDINIEGNVVVNETVTLPVDHMRCLVSLFFTQHHVLQ